jgi:hypothetical protein
MTTICTEKAARDADSGRMELFAREMARRLGQVTARRIVIEKLEKVSQFLRWCR